MAARLQGGEGIFLMEVAGYRRGCEAVKIFTCVNFSTWHTFDKNWNNFYRHVGYGKIFLLNI